MFRKVSVLVPTRKRLARLETLIQSYRDTLSDPNCVELLFRADDDDDETKRHLAHCDCPVLVGPRLDGYRSLPAFFDELRKASTGDVYLTGNDDMVFRTLGWAEKILAHANQYPDGLFCFGVETLNAKNFPFAVVSKRAVEIVGHIHDARLFWGDVYLRDIMAHFSRAIRIHDVQIDHEWAGHDPDETFADAKQGESHNWDDAYWALHRRCVAAAVGKLEAACLAAH